AHQESVRELAQRLARLTGRRLPAVPVPNALARMSGWMADAAQRVLPWALPLSGDAVREVTGMPVVDSMQATAVLGFAPRTVDETLVDTIRWLAEAGHISRRQAGRLAPVPTMAT